MKAGVIKMSREQDSQIDQMAVIFMDLLKKKLKLLISFHEKGD